MKQPEDNLHILKEHKKKWNANIQCWWSCPDIDSCIHLQPCHSHPLGRNVTIKNLFLRNNLAKAEQSLLISLTFKRWNAQGSALQHWLFSTHMHCLEDLTYEPRPLHSGLPGEKAEQERHFPLSWGQRWGWGWGGSWGQCKGSELSQRSKEDKRNRQCQRDT